MVVKYVYGTGAFARELAAYLRCSGFEVRFVCDRAHMSAGAEVLAQQAVLIANGDPSVRRVMAETVREFGGTLDMAFDFGQSFEDIMLNPGSIVCPGAVLTTNIVVGRNALININATVGHDCRIGEHSVICPGANISGGVILGPGVFVGSGAVIAPGIYVADGAKIGANAFVNKNVAAFKTVVGIPAQEVAQ